MRLGASLLRGLSPSRRKLPRHGAPGVLFSTFPYSQGKSTQAPPAPVVEHAAPCEVQRSRAQKNVSTQGCLSSAELPAHCNSENPVNSDSERIASPSIVQACVVGSQQEASTTTPPFDSSASSRSGSCTAKGATTNKSCGDNSRRCITQNNSNTDDCNCVHASDTLASGTDRCDGVKRLAAPTSLSRIQICSPFVGTAESVLEKRQSHEKRKEVTEASAPRAEQQRIKSASSRKTSRRGLECEHRSSPPSVAENGKTQQSSLLETKLHLPRAGSRSRLSRTLSAATGSVLRRLTPKAATRGSAQLHANSTASSVPLTSTVHAAAAVSVPASSTVQLSPAACAALAAAAAAGAESKNGVCSTSTPPIAYTSATLSSSLTRTTAAFGVSLTSRPSPATPTVAFPINRSRSKVHFASFITSPSLTCRAVPCAPQSGGESCETTEHEEGKEIGGDESHSPRTIGCLFVSSAGNAESAKLETDIQSGQTGTAVTRHRGQPTTDLPTSFADSLYSAERRTLTAVSSKLEETRGSSSSDGGGTERVWVAELPQNSSFQPAVASSPRNIDGTDEGICSGNGSVMAAAAVPEQNKSLGHNIKNIPACKPDIVTGDCKKDMLADSLHARPECLNNTAEMSQRPLRDMPLGGRARRNSAQQTPLSSSSSSFCRGPSSAGVSTQRRSSRSTRICHEKISHQRVEAVYLCPEGQLPVLRSLKVTEDVTKKEETLHQEAEEETEDRETRQETAKDAKCYCVPGQRRSQKAHTDGKESEEEKNRRRADKQQRKREKKRESEENVTDTAVRRRQGRQQSVEPCRKKQGCDSCLPECVGATLISDDGCATVEGDPHHTVTHRHGEGEKVSGKAVNVHTSCFAADHKGYQKKASRCRRSRSSRKTQARAHRGHTQEGREMQRLAEEHERALPHWVEETAAAAAVQSLAATPSVVTPEKQYSMPAHKCQQPLPVEVSTESSKQSFPSQVAPEQLGDEKRESPSVSEFLHSSSFSTTEGSPSSTDVSSRSSASLLSHRGSPVSPSTPALREVPGRL